MKFWVAKLHITLEVGFCGGDVSSRELPVHSGRHFSMEDWRSELELIRVRQVLSAPTPVSVCPSLAPSGPSPTHSQANPVKVNHSTWVWKWPGRRSTIACWRLGIPSPAKGLPSPFAKPPLRKWSDRRRNI